MKGEDPFPIHFNRLGFVGSTVHYRLGKPGQISHLIGLGAVVLGLALLVLAVALPAIWLGVIAFIGMVAGAVYAITGPSGTSSGTGSSGGGPGGGQGPTAPGTGDGGSFMRKMEERWEKRAGDDPRL